MPNMGGVEAEGNFFDQSSMMLGGAIIEELGDKGALVDQMQTTVDRLQRENEDLKQKIQTNNSQLNNASSSGLQSGEQGLIKHIKGALAQFLRNCAVTDRNNEELLSIVFSMMEFTPLEVSEVQTFRQNKSKVGGARANSVSSSGAPGGGTDPSEDEIKKRTSKGLFGMFRKGSKDKRQGTPGADGSLGAG